MKSACPSETQTLADLGDKVVTAFGTCVRDVRADLAAYRAAHPDWVAESSERGLANWIHDRMWAHLTRTLEGVDSVAFVEVGPTREMYVGVGYRLRAKRHSTFGAVSTYPTQTAIAFMEQDQLALAGLEQVNLCVGYRWDSDMRQVVEAVLSLRDGQDNIIWLTEINEPPVTGAAPVTPIVPAEDGPQLPSIEGPAAARAEGTEDE